MQSIAKSTTFILSVVSSLLLLLSVAYGQRLWSDLWVIYGFIQLGLICFFAVSLIISIVFWINKRRNFKLRYLPFCINVLFGSLTIILPLNWIRNRIEFTLYSDSFEAAYSITSKANITSGSIYKLPPKYQSLSVGGGEVYFTKKDSITAVLFYTFRGTPDGQNGFVKVSNGKINDIVDNILGGEVYDIKPLGNKWYYVSGE
jgi:hypothetical protein